ncbi:MAG: ATP-grasp domain-containing protein [Halobacteriota archaeon]
MRIMVAEYASQMMPKLAEEGKAIRDALCAGFRACGHVVHVPDRRLADNSEFEKQITSVARTCDAGIVVAPDDLLHEFTALVEANTLNLGCPASAVKLAADKLTSSRLLREGSLPVPEINPTSGPYVLKPRYGCGSEGVRVVRQIDRERLAEDTFVSKFITGEHISAGLIIGHTALPLSINKQLIQINEHIRYRGSVTPYPLHDSAEVLQSAVKAAQLLGCRGYVGIDMVLQRDGVSTIVDVNARPTTAIVGINRVIGNVAELMLEARLEHELPDFLAPHGKHTFLKLDVPSSR